MNKKIGIIGYGEIGKSLEKCYLGKKFDIFIKDINIDEGLADCDILNVCIPYSNNFVEVVSDYILQLNPKLTIIHSTVIPGTTQKIIMQANTHDIVHSPVRGVHPNLYEGLKTFTKYIGSDQPEVADKTAQHFQQIGINGVIVNNSKISELAKILCTTYYGMCIAWHNDINELCKELNVDFEQVSTTWNTSYNEGFKELGMENVVRPVLYPPKDNKIGGHCVIPNAELCKEFFNSPILDYILKLK